MTKLKLVCLSDTHCLQSKVQMPEGNYDVLIHCGDMGNVGKFREYHEIGEWFRSLKDRFRYQIIIPGNHDIGFMHDAPRILEECFDEDVICLLDKGVTIDSIKFYGTPWMPNFMNWAFMLEEEQLARYYDAIPDDTQVLITHSPPEGILDKTDDDYGYARCGSPTLRDRVKQLPKLTHHLFGHIHNSYGHITIDRVSYHNVASLNEGYRYQNAPQIITVGE